MYNQEKWDQNIDLAKTLLKGRRVQQMQVAELALEVCEVTWGGNNKSKEMNGMKTLKEFAAEIGMSAKTLSGWCAVKRNVFDKLSPDLKTKVKQSQLTFAARKINGQSTYKDVNEVVGNLVYSSNPDMRIMRYLDYLNSLISNLSDETKVPFIKRKLLEQVKWQTKEIIRIIDSCEQAPVKAVNHDMRPALSSSTGGLNESFGTSRAWKMRDNDKAVLDFLKRNNEKPLSTMFIGGKCFKNENINTAKLRAIRSLTKLKSMGLVLRDEFGSYKLKNERMV